jgi:hypothetical protein
MNILYTLVFIKFVFSDNIYFNFGEPINNPNNDAVHNLALNAGANNPAHDLGFMDKITGWALNSQVCKIKCLFDNVGNDPTKYVMSLIRSS